MSLILSDFECPAHGRFEALVERDGPDWQPCPDCSRPALWCFPAPMGKVKLLEVTRGGWQKPERKTWLDTRELGEGMPIEEFRAKRRKIRDEQRWKEIKDL